MEILINFKVPGFFKNIFKNGSSYFNKDIEICSSDILIQVDNFLAGGLENVVLDLNRVLISAGYRTVLLVLGESGSSVSRAKSEGMIVIVEKFSLRTYKSILNKFVPKVVLFHYSTHGIKICYRRKIPVVQVVHNAYVWFNKRDRFRFLKTETYTSLFIMVSEFVRNYTTHGIGIDNQKCIVIPNGINVGDYSIADKLSIRNKMRKMYMVSDDTIVFVSVGSINKQKNHITTIRAFSSVIKEIPNAKLFILGPIYENDLWEEIIKFISESRLDNHIFCLGEVTHIDQYYIMADAFISSSFFEGGQLSLLEAACFDLSVITSDVGFAQHFKEVDGFEVIESPFDFIEATESFMNFYSSLEFQERLAGVIIKVYHERKKPNLSKTITDLFDQRYAYACYVGVVEYLIRNRNGETNIDLRNDSWISRLV